MSDAKISNAIKPQRRVSEANGDGMEFFSREDEESCFFEGLFLWPALDLAMLCYRFTRLYFLQSSLKLFAMAFAVLLL